MLAALQALPGCWADRHAPEGAKATQHAYISRAIAAKAETVDEAAYLVTIAYHESRICLNTHAGLARGRGRGLWQIECASRRLPPFEGLSYEATEHAAGEALWMIRHSWQCGNQPKDRFTAYAGRACGVSWPTMAARVRTWYWVRGMLDE